MNTMMSYKNETENSNILWTEYILSIDLDITLHKKLNRILLCQFL